MNDNEKKQQRRNPNFFKNVEHLADSSIFNMGSPVGKMTEDEGQANNKIWFLAVFAMFYLYYYYSQNCLRILQAISTEIDCIVMQLVRHKCFITKKKDK